MAGAFSVHGSDEQIFGLKEQILGQDQSELRGVGPPVVGGTAPTDARVIAGTILGIAGMAINASMYWRPW